MYQDNNITPHRREKCQNNTGPMITRLVWKVLADHRSSYLSQSLLERTGLAPPLGRKMTNLQGISVFPVRMSHFN